jgi:hypothetical protein
MTPLKVKFDAVLTIFQKDWPVTIYAEIRLEKDIMNPKQGNWVFKSHILNICTSTSNLSVTEISSIGELWTPVAQRWIKNNIDLTHYYWTNLQDAELID